MTGPVWIEAAEALALHDRLISLYGGAAGLRDEALLASALARPRQIYAYAKGPTAVQLAAAYAVGLIRNHPFVDGNKRLGFLLCVLFLELNSYRFSAREEEATAAIEGLAARQLDEAGFFVWLRNVTREIGSKKTRAKT